MRKLRLTSALVAALAASFVLTQVSTAQPGGEPPPPPPANGNGYGGQGYYSTPPAQTGKPFHRRRGLSIGFGFGIGGMESENGPIRCDACDYDPIAGSFDFHVGGMINPRLALLFEVWGSGQQLDAQATETLVQVMWMFGAQYWVTPQLWLKGGIGAASLSISVDDGFGGSEAIDIGEGAAIMGAIGYEVMSTRKFAVDLQFRVGAGTYQDDGDGGIGLNDQITTAAFGVGFNWY